MQLRSTLAALCVLSAPLSAQDLGKGREDFLQYCAACHGHDATGNGPMAPSPVLPPPDLTELSDLNKGVFPILDVIARIDGRDTLVAHGSPMPVYRDFFEGKGVTVQDETGALIMTSQAIIDLVIYLESIQNQRTGR
ncbi:c-type cytochrome [Marinovum sp.]|uniref:c-type cytochrome n=1 Tax=Marinovum sp. TaxID=2024839 RepID=UPI002B279926|nr:c-type cytochrome [Marinovum sp.]